MPLRRRHCGIPTTGNLLHWRQLDVNRRNREINVLPFRYIRPTRLEEVQASSNSMENPPRCLRVVPIS